MAARTPYAETSNALTLSLSTPFNPSADFPVPTPPFSVTSMRVVSTQPAVASFMLTPLGGDQYRYEGTMLLAFEVSGSAQSGEPYVTYVEVMTPFSVMLRSAVNPTGQLTALLTDGTVSGISFTSGTLSFTYTGTLRAIAADTATHAWPVLLNAPQGACGRTDQQPPATTAPFTCTMLKSVALDAAINCETIGMVFFSGVAGTPPYTIVSAQPDRLAQGMFNVRQGGGSVYLYDAIVPMFLRVSDANDVEFDAYLPIKMTGTFVPPQPFTLADFDLMFDLQLTTLNFSTPDRVLVLIGRVLGLAKQTQNYPVVSFVQTLTPFMGTVGCARVAP